MAIDDNLEAAERCPACEGPIPPEAEHCPRCGAVLFEEPGPETAGQERPRFPDLVVVHTGPYDEVMAIQAALGARGVDTFLPDDTIQTIDPFITGGNVLAVDLRAPREIAADTRALIEEIEARKRAAKKRRDEALPEGTVEERLAYLGRRIRWSWMLVFTAPAGLCYAWLYFRECRKLGRRPAGHAMTVAGIVLCVLQMAGGLYLFLPPWIRP